MNQLLSKLVKASAVVMFMAVVSFAMPMTAKAEVATSGNFSIDWTSDNFKRNTA